MTPIFRTPPIINSPVMAIVLCLVTLTIAQAQQSTASKTASDWSADPQPPYPMTRASNRELRSYIAGEQWIGVSAERQTTAAKLGYDIAPFSVGKRPDRASGGHHDESGNGRPGGGEGNGGDESASGEDAGGGNAGDGNAGGGNAGGGNAGGANAGGRNDGDRNGDASAGDGAAGSGTSSDRSGDGAADASGGGNDSRGGRGGRGGRE